MCLEHPSSAKFLGSAVLWNNQSCCLISGGELLHSAAPVPFPSVHHFPAEPKLVSSLRGLGLNFCMLGLSPGERKNVQVGSEGEKCPSPSPGARGALAERRARHQGRLPRALHGCKLACNLLSVV